MLVSSVFREPLRLTVDFFSFNPLVLSSIFDNYYIVRLAIPFVQLKWWSVKQLRILGYRLAITSGQYIIIGASEGRSWCEHLLLVSSGAVDHDWAESAVNTTVLVSVLIIYNYAVGCVLS